MATGTGPCRSVPAGQSLDELGEDDLKVVFKALHSVAEKYVFLGLEMNVRMNEIRKIQSQCLDPRGCLLEVLSVRLKQIPSLTWRDIDTALRSDTVGEPQLAHRIRRQYGHLYSHDPSFGASLDQEQGRKMSEMTKSKNKVKKEKSSKRYAQQDSNKEVSQSNRYRKTSEKTLIDVNDEALAKNTQQKAKKSLDTKRYSNQDKQYCERETQPERKTRTKQEITKYDNESEVVFGSQDRHKVKYSEQITQKEAQIGSETESSVASSEQEIIQVHNSDSYSSEEEEDSAEEVSEAERYQKHSEQPKKEYSHSHRETLVTRAEGERGKSAVLSKVKSKVYAEGGRGNGKQMQKAVYLSDEESKYQLTSGKEKLVKDEMTSATHYIHKVGRKRSRKKAPKQVQRQNSATSSDKEAWDFSIHGKTRDEGKASAKKKALYRVKQVHKETQKQYGVVAAKHKQPTTTQTESNNSSNDSEEEPSQTPEPKRKTTPTIKYFVVNNTQMEAKTKPSDIHYKLPGYRKRKLSHKYQLTPKHMKLDKCYAASGKKPPSNHNEAEINLDESPDTLVEEQNSDISDIEEQHSTPVVKTARKKRVHSDSTPPCHPTSEGGTQSDSKCKQRETKCKKYLTRVKHQKIMKQESSSSSESDDDSSSPQCDVLRNLTESENKGFIKGFKRSFGKLCYAIKDPDIAAVELQARHLLSCSMVESLLTSPESQQVKAIALVRALKKRIKSCPVRVFTIIEVFLRNDILREAGRQLWIETGTTQPLVSGWD